jgi:outer membrane receptor protein involved in Fe transport
LGTGLSGDPNQHVVDTRNFVNASFKRHVGPGELQWRVSYDQYRYRDIFNYPNGESTDVVRDINRGDWFSSQVTYDVPLRRAGMLTVGTQGVWEVRNLQYNIVNGTAQDAINRPDRGVALFAQQEWNVSRRWKLYAGVRLDQTHYYQSFVSPRIAAVFQASPRTVYKLVYGRPFRNPSAFEQFYNDGGRSYAAASPLKPETAHAFEASFERRVARAWTVILNAFHYRIGDVIQAVNLADDVQQYRNADEHRSTGVEVEITGKLWNRLETTASTAFQDATAGATSGRLANAPRNISKLRLGAPAGRLFLSGNLQYLSARDTWNGDTLGGRLVADCTATFRLHRSFELQGGVRNALNRRYEDPIYLTVDRLRGDGRSVFLRLVWRVWE